MIGFNTCNVIVGVLGVDGVDFLEDTLDDFGVSINLERFFVVLTVFMISDGNVLTAWITDGGNSLR